MTIERKVGMGIAGQPSGGAADVAEVFSTDLWAASTTTDSTETINNGIDLSGEGGLVWIKNRNEDYDHRLTDTERGIQKQLRTNENAAEGTYTRETVSAFNSNGFSSTVFQNNKYVSWTFRKKSGFFDCVTFTGNGTTLPYISQTVSHNLGAVPAMMIVKQTSGSANWVVYHKDIGNTHELVLNETGGKADSLIAWNDTTPTNTVFTVGADSNTTNKSGQTFVAYLFADNSSEDADDQMIKCGSYTGNGSATGPEINLGWEPQFLMFKRASGGAANWMMVDSMRGLNVTGRTELIPNLSNAEYNSTSSNIVQPTSTGFKLTAVASQTNNASSDYIYMAIRAPMMVEPEAATDVFAPVNYTGDDQMPDNITGFGFSPDMLIFSRRDATSNHRIYDRLRGFSNGDLITDDTAAENSTGDQILQGPTIMDGFRIAPSGTNYLNTTGVLYHSLGWKRAKGFFDVVCYPQVANTAHAVPHSLGVVPEMMWIKTRDSGNGWQVYTSAVGATSYLHLNGNYNYSTRQDRFNNTAPTATHFTVGTASTTNGGNQIAYLFASLDGISKCGSYTGNGSYQTIDCGFSAGARFVLIKRANIAVSGNEGDWYFWDSVRGIVAGNDPHLSLNTTAAQVTTDDSVDPDNSGFIVNQVSATNINVSSGTYIFYAIA